MKGLLRGGGTSSEVDLSKVASPVTSEPLIFQRPALRHTFLLISTRLLYGASSSCAMRSGITWLPGQLELEERCCCKDVHVSELRELAQNPVQHTMYPP